MAIKLEASKRLFPETTDWLNRLKDSDMFDSLDAYGQMGVDALSANTPVESGETAASWTYSVTRDSDVTSIRWTNTKLINGTPLVILLQYGHGTGTGGYVEGRDFINPAMLPVFLNILDEVRKEIAK